MALVPTGTERITVSTTAIGFTAAKIPPSAKKVIMAKCKVEGATIRINDATTPTAGGAEGSQAYDIGGEFEVIGAKSLADFKAIRRDSADAQLQVIYYGEG